MFFFGIGGRMGLQTVEMVYGAESKAEIGKFPFWWIWVEIGIN